VSLGLTYFARAANLFATVLLTRLLLPEDFGHLALATAYYTFLVSLKEFGLSHALIHYRDSAEEMAGTHLLLNVGLSVVGTCLSLLVAVLLSEHYAPEAAVALAIFAVFNLPRSAAFSPETLLRKDLEFAKLAFVQTTAVLASLGAAFLLVWLGKGFWSIVVGYSPHSVVYACTFTALVWLLRPIPLSAIRFRPEHARTLFSYGRWFWIGWITSVLLFQYDKLVVGTLHGARALGIYERAFTFAQMPTGAITHALIGITNPLYSRYQQDREKLSAIFARVAGLILRTALPIALVIFTEADALVDLLLGERWTPMAPVLKWFVAYSFLRPLLDDVNSLLYAVGRPRQVTWFGLLQAALFLPMAPALTHTFGLNGAATSVGLIALVGVGLSLGYTRKLITVPWRQVFLPPVVAILAAGASAYRIQELPLPETPWLRLACEVALMSAVYFLVLAALEGRRLWRESRGLIALFRSGAMPVD
jgi:O-antigen/teichoic acid export membrane protein